MRSAAPGPSCTRPSNPQRDPRPCGSLTPTSALRHLAGSRGAEQAKRANEILAARDLALSVQVLQEFYVQATRQGSRPTHSPMSRPSSWWSRSCGFP